MNSKFFLAAISLSCAVSALNCNQLFAQNAMKRVLIEEKGARFNYNFETIAEDKLDTILVSDSKFQHTIYVTLDGFLSVPQVEKLNQEYQETDITYQGLKWEHFTNTLRIDFRLSFDTTKSLLNIQIPEVDEEKEFRKFIRKLKTKIFVGSLILIPSSAAALATLTPTEGYSVVLPALNISIIGKYVFDLKKMESNFEDYKLENGG